MSSARFRVREHIVPAQHIREYPGATASTQEDVLRLHVKQYTPLHPAELLDGAVTVIATHANGFPKVLLQL